MQMGIFITLYQFINQGFGNLARGIVPYFSAYMQNFMQINATVNISSHLSICVAQITVQIYM